MIAGTIEPKANPPTSSQENLKEWFDQVCVINLQRRPDRLAQFRKELAKAQWPFREPLVFSAIEGDKVGVPVFWQTGGGSYGCLRSHLTILERAIQDDIHTLLVLEDDALFKQAFAQDASDFLSKVPDDWECLMFGGQHVNSQPIPVAPGIVRAGGGGGIQRTHCYALRGQRAMKALYRSWAGAAVHCDWVMGPCMAQLNTYAPDPFLVGQTGGKSDISGQNNPEKFWRSPNGMEPVIILRSPRHVMETLQRKGWHGGYTRDPETGMDVGLKDLFADENLPLHERDARLKNWISLIQGEVAAIEHPAVCTIWHPHVDAATVRPLIQGRVVTITTETVEEAMAQLPDDLGIDRSEMEKENDSIRVIILRSSRAVMEQLREQGWHTGYSRDEQTGMDNGVRQLLSSTMDNEVRKAELQRITRVLADEAKSIPNGIATLWHDEITPDMLDIDDIQASEIHASTPAEAIFKLKDFMHE